jgi:hypothetical protein
LHSTYENNNEFEKVFLSVRFWGCFLEVYSKKKNNKKEIIKLQNRRELEAIRNARRPRVRIRAASVATGTFVAPVQLSLSSVVDLYSVDVVGARTSEVVVHN